MEPYKGLLQKKQIDDDHIRYINNFNEWKKWSLAKIGLANWKSSRNKLSQCKEGKIKPTISKIMCIPVSLTVLGLVKTPENAIQGLNQLAEKQRFMTTQELRKGLITRRFGTLEQSIKPQSTWDGHAGKCLLRKSPMWKCI